MRNGSRLALLLMATVTVNAFSQDWTGLHKSLIDFYRYQRAGLAPTASNSSGNPRNPFYANPGNDGKYPHSNDVIDGGWYDAGDFVKFGLPLGFTVYSLLLGYEVFSNVYDDNNSWAQIGTPNSIPDILDEVKVGTDYLIKCVQSSSRIALDIGDGVADHQSIYGESGYGNSNRLNNRQVRVWCDGADAAGLYAASLAIMSGIYGTYDAAYAATCLTKAKEAFTFCIAHQKISAKQTDNSSQAFYSTDTWQDKMALAAIELYRVTNEQSYLTWARDLMGLVGQHYSSVGYASCGDFVAYRFYQRSETGLTGSWIADIATAMGRVAGGNSLATGASVNQTNWAVCRTATSSGFSAALLYMVTGESRYRDFALQQLKWVAGISPYSRSYITQWGTTFPNNPHHRNDLNISGIRLKGGIVSGPTSFVCSDPSTCNWNFSDIRDAAYNTEPALDYNANAVGLAAFARYRAQPGDLVRLEQPLRASPDNVDFNVTATVDLTAAIERSVAWKIILTGTVSGATKQFTGNSTIISKSWAGDADNGNFVPGEQVTVTLEIANLWNVQAAMARTTVYLGNTKTEPFRPDDVLVDDFEDTQLLSNKLGGTWFAFDDLSAGGASTAPAMSSDVGKDGTKGLLFRLTRRAGAAHPVCGIRTTFSARESAVNLGNARSIVFDVYPTADNTRLWVELEQPSIVNGAFYSREVALGLKSSWYRIRIAMSILAQPSWKTSDQPLTLSAIKSLRFSGYGEASDRFVIDNVRIEGLDPSLLATRTRPSRLNRGDAPQILKATPQRISYIAASQATNGYRSMLVAPDGRIVYNAHVAGACGDVISLTQLQLREGMYVLRHQADGDKGWSVIRVLVSK